MNPTELLVLSSLCKLKRWISNWIRLVLLSAPSLIAFHAASESFRRHAPFYATGPEWHVDFDSTLGFPGEGPVLFGFSPSHISLGLWILIFVCQLLLTPAVRVAVDPSHGDALRRASRAGIFLGDGRRVTEATAFNRDWLYTAFENWVVEKGWLIHEVIYKNPPDIDFLNKVLVEYGRFLFSSGKPYYHFSETINAISSRRPSLRRMMQQAWDLAFLWNSFEPTTHHVAMPVQILCAFLATALSWGWSREAAVFALAWGALLRIGEVLQARRCDLVMPCDVEDTIDHILLRIWEPKTRFRAARHQCGKLEQPDLIEVIKLGFQGLGSQDKLWPFSGATLRLRFAKIAGRLQLPTVVGMTPKPLSLASFRPGGATHLITQTECVELVRRRGRWISNKVMECYLQEVTSTTYLNEVSPACRRIILDSFAVFPLLLKNVINFKQCKIPEHQWFLLLSKQKT